MISVSKLASAVLLAACTFVSVTSAADAATCNPNFQGNQQTIYVPISTDNVNEWTLSQATAGATISLVQGAKATAFAKGEFFVQLTGDAAGTYQIKMVADESHTLALTAGATGQLTFAVANENNDPTQLWKIDCSTCPPANSGVAPGLKAAGCKISNPSIANCITGSIDGAKLVLSSCNDPTTQQYSFISEGSGAN